MLSCDLSLIFHPALANLRHLQQVLEIIQNRLAVHRGAVAQHQVAQRIDDPQLRPAGCGGVAGVARGIQRVALQLRVFALQALVVGGIQRLAAGEGVAGAGGFARQADVDLPGQIDQALAILGALDRKSVV